MWESTSTVSEIFTQADIKIHAINNYRSSLFWCLVKLRFNSVLNICCYVLRLYILSLSVFVFCFSPFHQFCKVSNKSFPFLFCWKQSTLHRPSFLQNSFQSQYGFDKKTQKPNKHFIDSVFKGQWMVFIHLPELMCLIDHSCFNKSKKDFDHWSIFCTGYCFENWIMSGENDFSAVRTESNWLSRNELVLIKPWDFITTWDQ